MSIGPTPLMGETSEQIKSGKDKMAVAQLLLSIFILPSLSIGTLKWKVK